MKGSGTKGLRKKEKYCSDKTAGSTCDSGELFDAYMSNCKLAAAQLNTLLKTISIDCYSHSGGAALYVRSYSSEDDDDQQTAAEFLAGVELIASSGDGAPELNTCEEIVEAINRSAAQGLRLDVATLAFAALAYFVW